MILQNECLDYSERKKKTNNHKWKQTQNSNKLRTDFMCNITAQDIMDVADAMVAQGLVSIGYE